MPSPTTAGALIRQALGLTNAVGVDQTLTADETSDCLSVLNDIYEDLSNQKLAIWANHNETFNTVEGTATYTIGVGGTWNTVRPIRINDPAICTFQGADYPVTAINQADYNLIPVKTMTSQIVERYLYVNEFPLGQITLWPVPSLVVPITLSIDNVLTNIASAATTLSFPAGYSKMLKYMLAVDLAPLFGKEASSLIRKTALDTLANIKRVNNKTPTVRLDNSLMGSN